MNEKDRDRVYQYSKLYHLTHRKRDFLSAVKAKLGEEYLNESEVAWEAIDQYEGDVNPR